MKNFLLICVIIFPVVLFAQSNPFHIDSCGLDNYRLLSAQEASYFNNVLDSDLGYDFKGKRVLFAHDNDSTTIITKKDYFQAYGSIYHKNNEYLNHHVEVLTNEERERTGFDVIVITLPQLHKKEHYKQELLHRLKND